MARLNLGGEFDRYGNRRPQTLDEALIAAAREQGYYSGQAGDRTLHLAGSGEREASANLQSLLIAKQGWARPGGRRGRFGGGDEMGTKLAGLERARPSTESSVYKASEARDRAREGLASREEVARITAGGRTGAELVRGQQTRETAGFKDVLAIGGEKRLEESPKYKMQLKNIESEIEKRRLDAVRYGDEQTAKDLNSLQESISRVLAAQIRGKGELYEGDPIEELLRTIMILKQRR